MAGRQGRWPDPERRRLVAELRDEGLSLAEIGRRLGITKQAVHEHLKRPLPSEQRGVACRGCKGVAVPAGARLRERGEGLCPACLRRRGATFGRVLRACRLAAGMNKAELGRRSGLRPTSLAGYEAGQLRPRAANLARLAAVLGDCLAGPARGEASCG
jgi:transcriptional regulator with XRE-family HTH domain